VAVRSRRRARRWRAGRIARADAAAPSLAATPSSSAASSASNSLAARAGGSSAASSPRVLSSAAPNRSNSLAIARLDFAETSRAASSRLTSASLRIAAL
jgi:hypothetical protein